MGKGGKEGHSLNLPDQTATLPSHEPVQQLAWLLAVHNQRCSLGALRGVIDIARPSAAALLQLPLAAPNSCAARWGQA